MRRVVLTCLVLAACGKAVYPPPLLADCPRLEQSPLPSPRRRRARRRSRAARRTSCRLASAMSRRAMPGQLEVAMAPKREARLLAYVADADGRSHPHIDLAGRPPRDRPRLRVDGAPRQLLVLSDGRIVTTRSPTVRASPSSKPGEDLASPARAALLRARGVPAGRWGLALSPDDSGSSCVSSEIGAARSPSSTRRSFAVQRGSYRSLAIPAAVPHRRR